MSDRVDDLLHALAEEETDQGDFRARTGWIRSASDDEVRRLLEGLLHRHPLLRDASRERELEWILASIAQRRVGGRLATPRVDANLIGTVSQLYDQLGEASSARHHLLSILAASRDPPALARFAELMSCDPPGTPILAVVPLLTLMQRPDPSLARLFPRLLDALERPAIAAAVLDLANHLTRRRLVDGHPAAERRGQLARLLDGLVAGLAKIEQAGQPGQSAAETREQVSESVSLASSLCDALGLIGDESSISKLYQAMDLRHRRLRVEAAAALSRLGDSRGSSALVALAAEPVVRLRVLAYADELGLQDGIDPQYRDAEAVAEAELVSWLAQPTAIGMAPTQCQLVDRRQLYWPGFSEPVPCYLFRYTYHLPQGTYTNIGVAGPLSYSFTADLTPLSLDDIYAAYAGWQAEHPEIREAEVSSLTRDQWSELANLRAKLSDAGYEQIEPVRTGYFFGECILVARARSQFDRGVAVVDSQQILWFPFGWSHRPLGPAEAYCVYKGRQLLRTFNR